MTISMRLLKCCLFVSLLVALQPPVPPSTVIDEAYDRLQAADKCNLLCAPVRTITIVRLPSGLVYLATGFVLLVLLGLKGTMQTWLVHKSIRGCSQFFFLHKWCHHDISMWLPPPPSSLASQNISHFNFPQVFYRVYGRLQSLIYHNHAYCRKRHRW